MPAKKNPMTSWLDGLIRCGGHRSPPPSGLDADLTSIPATSNAAHGPARLKRKRHSSPLLNDPERHDDPRRDELAGQAGSRRPGPWSSTPDLEPEHGHGPGGQRDGLHRDHLRRHSTAGGRVGEGRFSETPRSRPPASCRNVKGFHDGSSTLQTHPGRPRWLDVIIGRIPPVYRGRAGRRPFRRKTLKKFRRFLFPCPPRLCDEKTTLFSNRCISVSAKLIHYVSRGREKR